MAIDKDTTDLYDPQIAVIKNRLDGLETAPPSQSTGMALVYAQAEMYEALYVKVRAKNEAQNITMMSAITAFIAGQ